MFIDYYITDSRNHKAHATQFRFMCVSDNLYRLARCYIPLHGAISVK
jgi:hypothetical protein